MTVFIPCNIDSDSTDEYHTIASLTIFDTKEGAIKYLTDELGYSNWEKKFEILEQSVYLSK